MGSGLVARCCRSRSRRLLGDRPHQRRHLGRDSQARRPPGLGGRCPQDGGSRRRPAARRPALRRALLGLEPRPDAEYAAAYDEARAALQAEVRLPALGPAQLLEPGGKKRAVELAGFGPGCASVRRKAGREPVCVPREKITSLTDAAGVAIGPVAIDTWTTSGGCLCATSSP